jgi:hypothetical protein
MYGSSSVSAFPVVGSGAGLSGLQTGNLPLLFMALAIFTLYAAIKAGSRIIPRTEA